MEHLEASLRRLGISDVKDGDRWSGAWIFIGGRESKPYAFVERVCDAMTEENAYRHRQFEGAFPLWTAEDRDRATKQVAGNAGFVEWLYNDCRARYIVSMNAYTEWLHKCFTGDEEAHRLITMHMMDQKRLLENRGSIARGRALGLVETEEDAKTSKACKAATRRLLREAADPNCRPPEYKYHDRGVEVTPYLEGWADPDRVTDFTKQSWRVG